MRETSITRERKREKEKSEMNDELEGQFRNTLGGETGVSKGGYESCLEIVVVSHSNNHPNWIRMFRRKQKIIMRETETDSEWASSGASANHDTFGGSTSETVSCTSTLSIWRK